MAMRAERAARRYQPGTVRLQVEQADPTGKVVLEAKGLRKAFGATVAHREVIHSDGVEEALLKLGESYVQLLMPIADTSPIAKYLDKNGEGLHHVGYRVDDCAAALEALKATGARVIDETPRPGSRGTTIAFVHPKAAFGTLIELVQE